MVSSYESLESAFGPLPTEESSENAITTTHLMKNELVLMTIEKLRGLLAMVDIECPQIVVIGEQSAGKSSVLESICEIEIPRGQTITTRVPLYLMMKTNRSLRDGETIIRLADNPQMGNCVRLKRTSEIQYHIVTMTQKNVPKEGDVQDIPIYVMIERKRCADLVLVDLPGLAYNAEDENIENIKENTEAMIRKYIQPASATILVAIEAQRDFGTQEVIKIAKEYDPKGERTLGIFTKTDRVEHGVDLRKKVVDGPIKFGLGNVCVVNRSLEDISKGMTLAEARDKESKFFKESSIVVGLSDDQWGVLSLRSHIVELQSRAIDKAIPEIKKQVNDKIFECRRGIANLPPKVTQSKVVATTFGYAKDINQAYQDFAEGNKVPTDEKYALCKNLYSYAKEAEAELYGMKSFTDPIFEEKINLSEAMVIGSKLPNFLNDTIFKDIFWTTFFPVAEKVVSELILKCVESCRATMMHVIRGANINSYPKLLSYFEECVTEAVDKCLSDLKHNTDNILLAEKHVGTVDSSYENILNHLRANGEENADGRAKVSWMGLFFRLNPLQHRNSSEMALSLEAYSILVKRRIVDQIPKLIRLYLVDKLQEAVTSNVLEIVQDGIERMHRIFDNNPADEAKRIKFEKELKAAEGAYNELKMILV